MKKYVFVLSLAALILGCKKDPQSTDVNAMLNSAQDQGLIENEFNSLFETVEGALNQNDFYKSPGDALPACATFTHDTVAKRIVIDFGQEPCLCRDGAYRRGKIVIDYTDRKRVKGATWTSTLEAYYVNDNKVNGKKTFVNLGDSLGHPAYSLKVEDASIEFTDGSVRSWSREAIIEKIAGYDTPVLSDDVLHTRSTAKGTNRRGRSYTAETRETLVRKLELGCARHFIDGQQFIQDDQGNTMLLDFDPIGGTPCDNVASISINGGEPRRITLR